MLSPKSIHWVIFMFTTDRGSWNKRNISHSLSGNNLPEDSLAPTCLKCIFFHYVEELTKLLIFNKSMLTSLTGQRRAGDLQEQYPEPNMCRMNLEQDGASLWVCACAHSHVCDVWRLGVTTCVFFNRSCVGFVVVVWGFRFVCFCVLWCMISDWILR